MENAALAVELVSFSSNPYNLVPFSSYLITNLIHFFTSVPYSQWLCRGRLVCLVWLDPLFGDLWPWHPAAWTFLWPHQQQVWRHLSADPWLLSAGMWQALYVNEPTKHPSYSPLMTVVDWNDFVLPLQSNRTEAGATGRPGRHALWLVVKGSWHKSASATPPHHRWVAGIARERDVTPEPAKCHPALVSCTAHLHQGICCRLYVFRVK